ncbi:hypothetical protein ScalyP_jg10200, partial [Parmales sp. scaly parma]
GGGGGGEEKSTVTLSEVTPIANKLREIFKLDLFGFDLLVTSEKREMVVVDVNYFPSYKEMSEYWPKLLAEYLVEMHLVRTKLSAGTSTGTGATTTGATTTTPIA